MLNGEPSLSTFHCEAAKIAQQSTASPSSVNRRETFDNDSMPSSSRAASTVRSPGQMNTLFASVAKPRNVSDQIIEWFNGIIFMRKLQAALIGSIISGCIFMLSIVSLRFSILGPVQFIYDAFSLIFSLSSWFASILAAFSSFASSFTLLTLLSKADQMRQASFKQSDNWIALSVVLFCNLFFSNLLLIFSGSHYINESFFYLLLGIANMILSYSVVFRNDHQLNFSGNVIQLGLLRSILPMFSLTNESLAIQAWRDTVHILGVTVALAAFIGPLIFGVSSLLNFLNISFYFTCGILLWGQLFTTKALMKLVRQIVMKPFTFPLPPPFAVHSPKPEQTRTLTAVLGSHDKLLKLFAFFDLRRIAWTDRIRRQEVFSLSQPGGHPRNWSTVSSSCVQVLDEVRNQLEVASSRIVSVISSFPRDIDDDDDEFDKEMLMMPYKARKQLYSSAIRQRHRIALRPSIPKKIQPGSQWFWLSKFSSIVSDKQMTISRYDANLCILSIESLYMLIVESYHDDRYGVVLKDLTAIIGVLLSLTSTIDKFFRSRATVANSDPNDLIVRQIDTTLQSAIYRIHSKFGSHLKSLDLSREQLQTIMMICQMDI